MDEILYLEPDEEITSVVDKLKGLEADSVGLVAPKGSSIVQSLVSLKLLQKQAKALGKEIAIVTSDEVGQNLAGRINLPVYADVRSKKPIEPIEQKGPQDSGPIEITDEPAVETAALKEAKEELPAKDLKESVQKPVEEEYKDLPKSFEVHRYDDKPEPEQAPDEQAESTLSKPDDQAQDEPKTEERAEAPDTQEKKEETVDPKFVNRPLHEKKIDERMDLESARPTIHEKKQFEPINIKKKSKKKIVFAVIGVVLLLVAVVLADLAIAKLNISVAIPADPFTKEVTLTAETNHPNVDLESGVIGATQTDKEISQDGSFVATGQKETGDAAKGSLTIQNELGTDVSLSSGASIRSSGGVYFTLDAAVSVPKATLDAGGNKVLGKATANITAKSAGTSGNLAATTSYSVEGKSGLSLVGQTSGGTTKTVKVVTSSDVDAAKKNLVSQATDKFKTDIKADADTVFLEDAFTAETSSFTTSKNANDTADNFTANAKVRVVALTFSKKDFSAVAIKLAEKGLPEGKSLLVTDADQVTPTLDEAQLNVGKLKLKGQLVSHIGPKIDLESMIAGFRLKPLKKIRSEIEAIPGASIKEAEISPAYTLPFGPIIKKNTHFNIEYTNK